MTTRPALDALHGFLTHPTTHNVSLLIEIPSLYDVLRYEYTVHREYSDAIISVCNWIYQRGKTVLDQLLMYGESLPRRADIQSKDPWSTVSLLISHGRTPD